MKEGNTTLSVPKDFASTLRKDYNGHNDLERLENWAKQEHEDSYNEDITEDSREKLKQVIEKSNNNSITLPEIKSAVEDALTENLSDEALGRY